MATAIAMRIVVRILFFATKVTQGPLLSVHYRHVKRIPNSRCVFRSVTVAFADTAKMNAHIRATSLPDPDIAGDRRGMLVLGS